MKQCSKTPKVTFKESSSSSPPEPISTLARQDLFSCLLPLCYRNTPTQAHPARSRLLRFLVFLLRYMLLGLLSLGNRASLNQRAVGSTPTRPTKNQPLTASTSLPPHPTEIK